MRKRTRLSQIIEGRMGIAVSNWRLARAVATAGQLGVVAGTDIDCVLVGRRQDGDSFDFLARCYRTGKGGVGA